MTSPDIRDVEAVARDIANVIDQCCCCGDDGNGAVTNLRSFMVDGNVDLLAVAESAILALDRSRAGRQKE